MLRLTNVLGQIQRSTRPRSLNHSRQSLDDEAMVRCENLFLIVVAVTYIADWERRVPAEALSSHVSYRCLLRLRIDRWGHGAQKYLKVAKVGRTHCECR